MLTASLILSFLALSNGQATTGGGPAVQMPTGFIRVADNAFVDDNCREYLYTGWNQWFDLTEHAIRAVQRAQNQSLESGAAVAMKNSVNERMTAANDAGFNVFRFFALGGDGGVTPLEVEPGVYNETVFQAIDYILAEAARHNLKAIVTLASFFNKEENSSTVAEWAGVPKDQFWNSTDARDLYKDHVKTVVQRNNTFTGKRYADDPTILAWDLINEPRCPADQKPPGCPEDVTDWYNTMAAYLKSIDPNHMVTTGEEGFFRGDTPYAKFNPYGINGVAHGENPDWAGNVGQDFVAQHSSPDIDFAVMHLWGDNWNNTRADFPSKWIAGHIQAAEQLKKPVIVEEFGKVAANSIPSRAIERDPVYRTVYNAVESNLASGGPLRAALFWKWTGVGELRDEQGVLRADTAFQVVQKHAAKLADLQGRAVPKCKPRAPVQPEPASFAAAG